MATGIRVHYSVTTRSSPRLDIPLQTNNFGLLRCLKSYVQALVPANLFVVKLCLLTVANSELVY